MSNQTKKSELANLPEITEIITYGLFTDSIELDEPSKEVPVSIMLVAPPEQGKTAAVNQFDQNRGILYIDNTTAWGIENKWLNDLKEGRVRRVLIPDFVDPTNRKKSTVDTTITFFNKYISWEGLRVVQQYKMSFELREPMKGSLLTTMALGDFLRMIKSLAAVGFLSRLLIVGYKYNEKQLDDLLDDIYYKRAGWNKIHLPLPNGKKPIELDPNLAVKMKPLSKYLGERAGVSGIRASLQMSMLAKGRALSQNREEVSEEDVSRIMYLAERYINNVSLTKDTRRFIGEKERELEEVGVLRKRNEESS